MIKRYLIYVYYSLFFEPAIPLTLGYSHAHLSALAKRPQEPYFVCIWSDPKVETGSAAHQVGQI